jgi:hypothetical protein
MSRGGRARQFDSHRGNPFLTFFFSEGPNGQITRCSRSIGKPTFYSVSGLRWLHPARKPPLSIRGPNSPGARQSKRGPTEWVRSGRRLVQPDRFGPMFTKPGYLIGAARARLSRVTLKGQIIVGRRSCSGADRRRTLPAVHENSRCRSQSKILTIPRRF